MPVDWNELLLAYEFASAGSPYIEHRAWVCRTSGRLFFWDSDSSPPLEEEEDEDEPSDDVDAGPAGSDHPDELPPDILDEEKYLPIPDKRELDLGSQLVFKFVREHLAKDYDEVRRIFSKRGAYSKFKGLLERRNAVDQWYDFENRATENALREWCEVNSIEIEEPKLGPREG